MASISLRVKDKGPSEPDPSHNPALSFPVTLNFPGVQIQSLSASGPLLWLLLHSETLPQVSAQLSPSPPPAESWLKGHFPREDPREL